MSRRMSYDKTLFGSAILIVVVGLVMIYSASAIIATQKSGTDNPYYFIARQGIFLIAGAALMFGAMHVRVDLLKDWRVAYGLLILLSAGLILVLFQSPINGTHRWFTLGTIHLQPSEFAKPMLVIFLASYLAAKEERINDLTAGLLPLLGILTMVAGLILLQPDFGTAAIILAVAGAMIFVAGLSWQRIFVTAAVVLPVITVVMVSADYRRERLLTFLNPEADPLGKGFQAMQSLIAIGTGGVGGLGVGNGRQKLFFLPEPHTDFIFSIIGEELGFLGAVAILSLFALLVWRGLRIAWRAEDRFVFYAALGLALLFAFQVLVNVSVTVSLLPTKGLPLPLISYGGSSLLASLLAVGLLLNLSQRSD
ncbi:MAG TPA: putative lipid II flippase FtsW [Thermoanaerobaculia bacterium]|nr:putative lipid II flippase FtsW [Thermoanaerobaculia bacterium]